MARRNIELPEQKVELLDAYCRLLWDWNAKINLTRHSDYDKFVERDLIDTLAISEFLVPGERILDVGTGGGVPGVPLAIIRDDIDVWLCESVGKKAKAVGAMLDDLKLDATMVHGRAEDLLAAESFDTLVIRAVAKMSKLLRWFESHWDSIGRLLLVKGPAWVEERGEARHVGLLKGMALRKLKSYPIPDAGTESVLLQIRPEDRE